MINFHKIIECISIINNEIRQYQVFKDKKEFRKRKKIIRNKLIINLFKTIYKYFSRFDW